MLTSSKKLRRWELALLLGLALAALFLLGMAEKNR